MSQTLISRKTLAPALAAAAMAFTNMASSASLTEGFDALAPASAVPAGWRAINNSVPGPGTSTWFNGNPAVFGPQAGASYIGANFNSGLGLSDLSTWLITPDLTFSNGDVVSFWTRTVALSPFPDRLQLRFASGVSAIPGAGSASVGTFTTLLLDINPALAEGGYPEAWTRYSTTISGLGGPTLGSLAFRYFVPGGGPLGDNSNFIGIDTFTITAVPEPGTYGLMALGIAGVLVAARRRKTSAA